MLPDDYVTVNLEHGKWSYYLGYSVLKQLCVKPARITVNSRVIMSICKRLLSFFLTSERTKASTTTKQSRAHSHSIPLDNPSLNAPPAHLTLIIHLDHLIIGKAMDTPGCHALTRRLSNTKTPLMHRVRALTTNINRYPPRLHHRHAKEEMTWRHRTTQDGILDDTRCWRIVAYADKVRDATPFRKLVFAVVYERVVSVVVARAQSKG